MENEEGPVIDLTGDSDSEDLNSPASVVDPPPVKKEPPAGSRLTPRPGPRRSRASTSTEVRVPRPACSSTVSLGDGLSGCSQRSQGQSEAPRQPLPRLLARPAFPSASFVGCRKDRRSSIGATELREHLGGAGRSQSSHSSVSQGTVKESLSPNVQQGFVDVVGPSSTDTTVLPLPVEEGTVAEIGVKPPVQVRAE
jgi:hypothetical protein